MKFASVTQRLSGLGGEKWAIHQAARQLVSKGQNVIELTIGEPDVPTPDDLIEEAIGAMKVGRTNYSDGRGELNLRRALSERYKRTIGKDFSVDRFLCFPGTQTSLYAVMMGLVETGDQVLVGDPLYATYEGVIASTGAEISLVPLSSKNGFRLSAEDLEVRITENSRVILLNTPHNPTGSVMTKDDLLAIGDLAQKHDLWIVSDEVYEELIFDNAEFVSPLQFDHLADRTIAVSSISKSHAAPGFRSGWCLGPAEFTSNLLPLSETMLFGNQPFIADMTAKAISGPSEVAVGMRNRFYNRAVKLKEKIEKLSCLKVQMPQAGMFALVDVSALGMNGFDFAMNLLKEKQVAVMPGTSFGNSLNNWVRLALTVDDEKLDEAINRMAEFAQEIIGKNLETV